MKIDEFSIETLLIAAIKSEIEANKIYSRLAKKVKNAMLKDRLDFLAAEEEKHRGIFEKIYREKFPGKDIQLPGSSAVPLPSVKITNEMVPLSDVFTMAMDAEMAAFEFYNQLAQRFEEPEMASVIRYAASMEQGHYDILKVERDNLDYFEEAADYNPFIHLGP
jgi:rubrerythrin